MFLPPGYLFPDPATRLPILCSCHPAICSLILPPGYRLRVPATRLSVPCPPPGYQCLFPPPAICSLCLLPGSYLFSDWPPVYCSLTLQLGYLFSVLPGHLCPVSATRLSVFCVSSWLSVFCACYLAICLCCWCFASWKAAKGDPLVRFPVPPVVLELCAFGNFMLVWLSRLFWFSGTGLLLG